MRLGVEAQLQPGVPNQQEGHPRHEVDDDDQDEGDDPRDHRVQLPPAVHRQGGDLRQLRVVNLKCKIFHDM